MATAIKNNVSIDDILNRLHGVKKVGDNQWQALCPVAAHDDHSPSFHIGLGDDGKILMHCKRGCSFNDICQALNIEPHDTFSNGSQLPANQNPHKEGKPIFSRDEIRPLSAEKLSAFAGIKQVNRNALWRFQPYLHLQKPLILLPAYNPNRPAEPFGWMRLARDGGLVSLADGRQEKSPVIGKHGLLGVPWLTKENPDTIIFVEGWRDALAAIGLGFHATASSGGASCFKNDWLPLFNGRIVYLCFDSDIAGVNAGERAAKHIATVAKETHIIKLPYSVQSDHGADLHDYLVRDGHTTEDLLELMKQAESFKPVGQTSDAGTGAKPAGYNRTDARNAERFTEQHSDIIRHCRKWNAWLLFDSRRWNRDIGTETANQFALKTTRQIIDEAKSLR